MSHPWLQNSNSQGMRNYQFFDEIRRICDVWLNQGYNFLDVFIYEGSFFSVRQLLPLTMGLPILFPYVFLVKKKCQAAVVQPVGVRFLKIFLYFISLYFFNSISWISLKWSSIRVRVLYNSLCMTVVWCLLLNNHLCLWYHHGIGMKISGVPSLNRITLVAYICSAMQVHWSACQVHWILKLVVCICTSRSVSECGCIYLNEEEVRWECIGVLEVCAFGYEKCIRMHSFIS